MALAVVACGNDGGEPAAEPTTSDSRDADQTTSTRPEETTTTVAAEGPSEWVEVARDLYERDFQLRADPDPARVADLYAETCTCWDAQISTIEFLAERNEHVEGQAANVLFVKYEQTDPETGIVNLTVRGQTNPLRRVSSDGEVVQEIPPDEPSCIAYALRADGPGGAYRIYSQTTLPACPEGA